MQRSKIVFDFKFGIRTKGFLESRGAHLGSAFGTSTPRNKRQISRRSGRWGVGDGGLILLGKLTNIRYRGQNFISTYAFNVGGSKKKRNIPICHKIADHML